ncbi:T9SS type B sorting domain-containing protein [Nonlabens ulvanivorans]
MLKQLDTVGPGWDGNYNGQPLPSSDYWFKIEYEQDGRKGEATGHFALKR